MQVLGFDPCWSHGVFLCAWHIGQPVLLQDSSSMSGWRAWLLLLALGCTNTRALGTVWGVLSLSQQQQQQQQALLSVLLQ